MAKLTPDQLSMWHLMTSEASPSATSSPGSEDGLTPCASPSGPTTDLCGRAHAPASRSRSQAKAPVQMIQGTCGPTSTASSPPSGPLSSWESRLRERLAMVGSTECALIWRKKTTPAGASIFRLARWTPPTSDSGFIGSLKTWHTPTCHMAKEAGYPAEFTRNTIILTAETYIATWPTPITNDATGSTHCYGKTKQDGSRDKILKLPGMVQATWPTPTTPSGGRTSPEGTTTTGIKPDGTKTQVTLEHVTKATWPTPTCPAPHDSENSAGNPNIKRNQKGSENYVLEDPASGPTTFGLPEQMGNQGALNPAFPCWLMGYPTAWDDCAPTVTPSSRRSRQK